MLRKRNESGFTLIEIMVVVVIIGLLVGLAGPKIWALLGFGQESIAETKCKDYYESAKMWKTINKKFPDSLEEMEAPLRAGETENYLRVEDDPWGNPYVLERDGRRIRVVSWGPDGEEGTEDDLMYPPLEEE
jgi:general secretion pathway protein G